MKNFDIIVIGAGISGISASTETSLAGYKTLVLESRNQAGGRMYSFTDHHTGEIIDNGQHIMVGAYKHFLNLLTRLGTQSLLKIQEHLKVLYTDNKGQKDILNTSLLPGQLGFALGVLKLKGISISSKFQLTKLLIKILLNNK